MNFAASRLRVRIGNAPYGGLRLRRLHLEVRETDEFARRIHPTGGLRPPLLFRSANVCRQKKRFLRYTYAHPVRERRPSARRGSRIAPAGRFDLRSANNATSSGERQPAAVSRIAPARTIPQTSAHDRRTQHQERRASARRGSVESGPATGMQWISAPRTRTRSASHLRLLLQCERLPQKTSDTHTHIRSGASARRGSRNAPAMQFDLLLANHAPAKTAVSPPRFDQLNAACGVSETHMRERFVPHGRLTPTALGRDDG
jgi:hypothetical protein